MNNSENKFENLRYLLGNLGIDILIAIGKGAYDFQTVEIISGVPIECVKGRIPVLIDLQLVEKSSKGFVLTEEGILFKQKIEKKA
jgi:predicted transcriptional regulator